MKLPDALIVRYFRADELDSVKKVTVQKDGRILVNLKLPAGPRTDLWRDLEGGLGFVPDKE